MTNNSLLIKLLAVLLVCSFDAMGQISEHWRVQLKDTVRMYLKCSNLVNTDLFDIKGNSVEDLNFNYLGGRIISQENGVLDLMPDTAITYLEIFKGQERINRSFIYGVPVPKPLFDIVWYDSEGQPNYLSSQGEFPPGRIEVSVIADQSFNEFLPRDATYSLNKWVIVLLRMGTVVYKKEFSGIQEVPDLNDFKKLYRPGDYLVFKATDVRRKNALGEWIESEPYNIEETYRLR